MKLKIIVAGSGKVSASTRSKGAEGSTASRSCFRVARTRGSMSATRRGVNAREAGRRRRVCAGGSRLTIEGCGLCPPASRISAASAPSGASGTCAAAAEYVAGSRSTASTSAWRVTT
jgi:hypothetical protein